MTTYKGILSLQAACTECRERFQGCLMTSIERGDQVGKVPALLGRGQSVASSRSITSIVAPSLFVPMPGTDRKQTERRINRPLVAAGWATFSWFTIRDDRLVKSNWSRLHAQTWRRTILPVNATVRRVDALRLKRGVPFESI